MCAIDKENENDKTSVIGLHLPAPHSITAGCGEVYGVQYTTIQVMFRKSVYDIVLYNTLH